MAYTFFKFLLYVFFSLSFFTYELNFSLKYNTGSLIGLSAIPLKIKIAMNKNYIYKTQNLPIKILFTKFLL